MSANGSDVKHANNVYYTAAADGNLVTRRTTKRHHAIDELYECSPQPTGRQLEFLFDLGSEYVDGVESYLKFQLEYNTSFTTTTEAYPGKLSSGYTDMIQDILLIDRNGVEIERIDNVYQIASILATSTHTDASLRNTSVFPVDKRVEVSPVSSTVIIPLHFLLGLFRTDTLIPPHILDKATLRIRLRDANLVFSPTTTTIPSFDDNENWTYSWRNPTIVYNTYNLDHRLHELITQEYETTGLHFQFTSHTHLGISIPNTEYTDTVQITQSFSRATKVMLAIEAEGGADQYFNNMLSSVEGNERDAAPWVYGALQARINDVTYPDTPVTEYAEAWQLWLTAFRAHRGMGVSEQAKADFIHGERVIIDMDRGTVGSSSGQIISNKFPVQIRLNLLAAAPHKSINPSVFSRVLNRRMHAFIEHHRVLLAKADNAIVLV
jgi:hypothetical protein